MRKPSRGVLDDPEVIAMLRDDPELLALADAIHATLGADHRRRRRRMRAARLAAIAAAVVAAVTLANARPWGGGAGGLIEAALAAVPGEGPVVHAVVRTQVPGRELIEVASGRSIPVMSELEFWFDQQRGILHTVVRREGQVVVDILATPRKTISAAGPVLGASARPLVDPMLVGFVTGYRDALGRGMARPAGRGLLAGRPVVWIDMEGGLRRQRIGLDANSLRPLAIRALTPGRAPDSATAQVLRISVMERNRASFARPSVPPAVPSGGVVQNSVVLSRGSLHALDPSALWAGRRSAGLRLRLIQRQTLLRMYPKLSGRRPRLAYGLDLLYGSVRGGRPIWQDRFLEIQQARTPEPAYGFLSWPLQLDPLPRPGFVRVERRPLAGSAGRAIWVGQLRHGGRYVTLTASSRAILIAAARALRPVNR